MQFTIENGSTTDKIAVAIATGNIDTEGFELDGNGSVAKHNHNAAGLRAAGYAADVVLDDAVVTVGEGHTSYAVTMSTAAGKTINHCKRYLEHNPRCVKRVTIAATSNGHENPAAFNASMFLASLNPFQKEAAREVDMSQWQNRHRLQPRRPPVERPPLLGHRSRSLHHTQSHHRLLPPRRLTKTPSPTTTKPEPHRRFRLS